VKKWFGANNAYNFDRQKLKQADGNFGHETKSRDLFTGF